jgi:hypothetical protein
VEPTRNKPRAAHRRRSATWRVKVEKRRPTLAQAFETAMVDAINRYVREVLKARGCISQEGFDEHVSEACLQAKYAIAREWAAKWAAFFDDPQAGKQSPAEQGAAADRPRD